MCKNKSDFLVWRLKIIQSFISLFRLYCRIFYSYWEWWYFYTFTSVSWFLHKWIMIFLLNLYLELTMILFIYELWNTRLQLLHHKKTKQTKTKKIVLSKPIKQKHMYSFKYRREYIPSNIRKEFHRTLCLVCHYCSQCKSVILTVKKTNFINQ